MEKTLNLVHKTFPCIRKNRGMCLKMKKVGYLQVFLYKNAVDRQSKDLGSNPSAVESVFFPQKDFQIL